MGPLDFAALALVSVLVGFAIGAVGVGGILMVPALIALGGLGVHQASATALFTFFFTGILGTILFQRRGSIDWRMALPVCIAAVLSSYAGALVNSLLGAPVLSPIIALLTIAAGAYVLLPQRQVSPEAGGERSGRRLPALIAVGVLAGFGSGLTGAGGPLFSVPIMLILGFAPLASIGVSQVLQIVSAASGTLGNITYGSVNFMVAGGVVLFELAGVLLGVRAAHVIPVAQLRKGAAWLCIVAGTAFFLRSI